MTSGPKFLPWNSVFFSYFVGCKGLVPYWQTAQVYRLKLSIGHITLLLSAAVIFWISACKPKHICPAYQSAFYLDKKMADLEFTPFDKDTQPKMESVVRKTDVLTIIRLGKKKIDKRMAVIPMITVFPEQEDSLLAMADSMAADSAMVEDESNEGEIADSAAVEEGEGELKAPDSESEDPDAPPKEAFEEPEPEPKAAPKPKTPKKTDTKDPELSDPSLKAEFEESFDIPTLEDEASPAPADVPKLEEEEEGPPPPPKELKKAPKKDGKKEDEPNPKDPEPAQEDDKF